MIPDEESMITIAQEWEARLHREGWDNNEAKLALIEKLPNMEALKCAEFRMFREMPGHPFARLRTMANAALVASVSTARSMMPEIRRAALAGVLLSSEAWMNDKLPEEELDGRRLADIPGSKEARYVMILDCAGRTTVSSRVRGEPPAVHVQPPYGAVPGAEFAWDGQLSEALRDFLLGLARTMPFGSVDLDAVRACVREESANES